MKAFKYSFFSFLLLPLCLLQYLSSEIIEVDNLNCIKQELSQVDKETLVLFDVDYTLIIPDDAILRPCGQKLVKKLRSEFVESSPATEKYPDGYLHSQIILRAKSSLVDQEFSLLVNELQNSGIPTIALTAAPGGKLSVIDSLADWRIKELKSFGFDFTKAFPNMPVLKFPKWADKEFYPMFKSGVLFSSKHPKGDVLKQFLEVIQWYPKKVILIDDRIEYLQSAEAVLNQIGIKFIGFYYTAAEKLPCTLDEKLAEFQFQYLAEHAKWLSDSEAKNMMDSTYMMPAFQIIYINGPSSSGKTTLAKALQQELNQPFLHIGIDRVIGMMPEKINNWEGGSAPLGFSWKSSFDEAKHPIQEIQMGPFAKKMNNTLKEIVLTLARMNHYIIIDDIAFGKEDVDKWKTVLKGYKVLWIGIRSPLTLLEEREKQRGNRIIGSARSQFFRIHQGVIYDLEFDTSQDSLEKIIQAIKEKLCPQ